jgi:uncharacterized protein (DUF433 family)
MARVAAMMLDQGRVNGVQIMPETVIDRLSNGASTEALMKGPSAEEYLADGHLS